MNRYDDLEFFAAAQMSRSKFGLEGAGKAATR